MNRAAVRIQEAAGFDDFTTKITVVALVAGVTTGRNIQASFDQAFEQAVDIMIDDSIAVRKVVKVARKLVPLERDVLLGRIEGWGASVGAAIESLRGHRCMDGLGNVTPFGEKVTKAVVALERVGE